MDRTFERDRWRRVDAILDAVLDLPPGDRAAHLDAACEGDAELRRYVDELLAAHDAADPFLAAPAAVRAAPLFAAVDRDSPVGRTVGAYRLVRELGEGGMGAVFLAERVDGEFEQRVAIKILKYGLYSDEARRRFRQERQILAQLEHPAIARLLDGGVTQEGTPFFVMELVEGREIAAHCRDAALGVDDRLRLFLQACDAVQYAHASLIVHRDLKPSNILVDANGRVKLLDFGIAKLLNDAPSAGPARTLVPALTPEYAAPEQIRGEAVTTAADVYGLGVVLYELLTGERPYRPKSAALADVERAVMEQDAPPPSTRAVSPGVRRRVRGELDRIALKALAKQPDRRYVSAEALASDVRRYLSGLPVEAVGDHLWYRARKFLGRHRVGVAAAAVVALSLVAGLLATAWQVVRVEREAKRTQAVQDFLASVFSASDPTQARGRMPTARDLLDRGAARIDREMSGEPEVRARLSMIIAQSYRRLGEYDRAEPLYRSALALARAGAAAPADEADVLDALAMIAYQKSDYCRAIGLAEEALAASQRLGRDTRQEARIANDVAWIRRRLGEYDAAEQQRRRAFDIYRRLNGPDDPETLRVQNDLGVLLADMGRFPEAEALERGALDADRRRLGDAHPDTINAAYELSRVLVDANKYAEAESILRTWIPLARRVLGEQHDKVAMSVRMLSWALDAQARYDEAAERAAESLALYTVRFGPRDSQVAVTLRRRAEVEAHLGRYADAERDLAEALSILAERFTEGNYDVGATRHVLALVRLASGRADAALGDIEAARINRERFLGTAHPRYAETLELEGDIEAALGRTDRAVDLHRRALAIERDRLGDDRPATLVTRAHLAALGDGDAAAREAALRASIDGLKRQFPSPHPDVASSLAALAALLHDTGRPDEARAPLGEALAIRRALFGPDDARTRELAAQLAAWRAGKPLG